mmetsp:Transcript_32177/g.92405  ORF Transcript_32177/g.92405 Transcript_32177/m.92405 type:complete len:329 (+) Transcript_32177:70-1056(+)
MRRWSVCPCAPVSSMAPGTTGALRPFPPAQGSICPVSVQSFRGYGNYRCCKGHLSGKVWRGYDNHGCTCDCCLFLGASQPIRAGEVARPASPVAVVPLGHLGQTGTLAPDTLLPHISSCRGGVLASEHGQQRPCALRLVCGCAHPGLLGNQLIRARLRGCAPGNIPFQGGAHPRGGHLQVCLHVGRRRGGGRCAGADGGQLAEEPAAAAPVQHPGDALEPGGRARFPRGQAAGREGLCRRGHLGRARAQRGQLARRLPGGAAGLVRAPRPHQGRQQGPAAPPGPEVLAWRLRQRRRQHAALLRDLRPGAQQLAPDTGHPGLWSLRRGH